MYNSWGREGSAYEDAKARMRHRGRLLEEKEKGYSIEDLGKAVEKLIQLEEERAEAIRWGSLTPEQRRREKLRKKRSEIKRKREEAEEVIRSAHYMFMLKDYWGVHFRRIEQFYDVDVSTPRKKAAIYVEYMGYLIKSVEDPEDQGWGLTDLWDERIALKTFYDRRCAKDHVKKVAEALQVLTDIDRAGR